MIKIFKLYIEFYKKNPLFYIFTIFSIIYIGMVPVATSFFSKVFLEYTLNRDLNLAIFLCLIILVIQITSFLFKAMIEKKNYIIAKSKELLMNEEIFIKTCKLDSSIFDNRCLMDKMSRASEHAKDGNMKIVTSVNTFFSRIISIMGISVLATVFKSFFILLIVLFSTIISIILRAVEQNIYYNYKNNQIKNSRIISYFSGLFKSKNTVIDIKTNNGLDLFCKEYENNVEEGKKATLSYFKKRNANKFFSLFNVIVSECIIYIYLGIQIINSNIDVPTFTMFIAASQSFGNALNTLSNSFLDMRMCKIERMYYNDYLNCKEKVLIGTTENDSIIERIVVKNLSFSYGEKSVLKNVDLTINKGEKIAIVGHNGSGKTTFANLLLGLYCPSEGTIKYNDVDVVDLEMNSFFRKVGYLQQDSVVFSISIKDNVFFLGDVSLKYLEKLSILERIKSSKYGLDTKISRKIYDEGTELSGGERQKLLLARLFSNDSQLLILDEYDKYLDEHIKNTVLKIIQESKKTIIYITHDVNACKVADKIYRIDSGNLRRISIGELKNNDIRRE